MFFIQIRINETKPNPNPNINTNPNFNLTQLTRLTLLNPTNRRCMVLGVNFSRRAQIKSRLPFG